MPATRYRKRRASSSASATLGRYWTDAQSPLQCLAFVAPFLVAFEVGVALIGTDLLARRQVYRILYQFGATAAHLSPVLVVAVLLAWQAVSRRPWRIEGGTLLFMVGEAIVLVPPLLGMHLLSQRILPAAPTLTAGGGGGMGLLPSMLAGTGAGIYEEFLFRLVGLNLITLLLVDVFELPKGICCVFGVCVCSALFAWYHFPGEQAIDWSRFLFYLLAGAYLGGVFVLRGFGIVVGVHIFYNMTVDVLRVT